MMRELVTVGPSSPQRPQRPATGGGAFTAGRPEATHAAAAGSESMWPSRYGPLDSPGLLPWTARNAHRGWVKASPEAASDQLTAAGSGAASPASEPQNMPMTGAMRSHV